MERRERYESPMDALLAVLDGRQREIWTALPCIIQSFDPATQTCTAQPSVQVPVKQLDGSLKWTTLPLLVDCPVHFPNGGGFTLTFPVAAGDEALVVFSSRTIDAWWAYGGIQHQPELRMHDLSDGFVFVGLRSQVRLLSNISTNTTQLRSDDGSSYVEVAGAAVTIHATTVNVACNNATVNATVSATIASASIILKNTGAALKKLVNDSMIALFNAHVHTDLQGGNTGAPTTTMTAANTTSVVQAE